MTLPEYIHGVHDADGASLMDGYPGWVVITEAIGHDPNDRSGRDYSDLARQGFGVMVRLNNAHDGVNGTIPEPRHYRDFATRCANFVAASTGITLAIIGNEPNHANEWPRGQQIDPASYARCYGECRMAIQAALPGLPVLVAAVAPWNGDWLAYLQRIVNQLWTGCDGFALHAYTHGSDPKLIFSDEMQHGWYWHFRVYRQQMVAIREIVKGAAANMIFVITETDQGDGPWLDADSGWVRNAYQEIADWNALQPLMPIRGLVLYRANRDDKWSFADKEGVKEDFRQAVERGYKAPQLFAQKHSDPTFLPNISAGGAPPMPPATNPLSQRLIAFGATLKRAQVQPGQPSWQIISADGPLDRGGNVNIYVDVLDEQGKRVVGVPVEFYWADDHRVYPTEAKPGEDQAVNMPMYAGGNAYGVRVVDGTPSDDLFGMGLVPFEKHKSYHVVFQRKVAASVPATPPPAQVPVPVTRYVSAAIGANLRAAPIMGEVLIAVPFGQAVEVLGVEASGWLHVRYGDTTGYMAGGLTDANPPVATTPQPSVTPGNERDNWTRAIAFVRRAEGGWADNPNDPGGKTNKGITLDTFTRWRKGHGQPQPTVQELRDLSDEEANRIYYDWYWLASGADKLPWPLALAHFDTAANAGVGRAQEMLAKSNGNFLAYMGHLIDWYTRIENFEHFGRAWIRRRAQILLEASK